MLDAYFSLFTDYPWFAAGLSGVLGAIVGSFLNVCIYRIPAGKSVVRPGSHCACGKPVAWRDNVPVLSWLLLRGRARCCGRPFSARYPAIEALTGLLFAAAVLTLSPGAVVPAWIFTSFLVCAAFIDLDTFEIPDVFSVGLGVLGVVLSVTFPNLHYPAHEVDLVTRVHAFVASLQGLLLGSGLVLWIALLSEAVLRKETMGFGDVKFVGAIGAFCGWHGAITSIFGGAILGCVWFVFALVYAKIKGKPLQVRKLEGDEKQDLSLGAQVPYGPMLAAAGLLHLLWAHQWVDPFFNRFAEVLAETMK